MNELDKLLHLWPKAVDPSLICSVDSEEDKMERANNIMTLFVNESLEGKKFLDFGCGEGHTIKTAEHRKAALAIGYDVNESGQGNWSKNLTTDFKKVESEAPYDVILLYDILDHVESMDKCLEQVRKLCKPFTKVFILTHPWCSRHGGHLYQKFNYAYAHNIFTEDELIAKGIEVPRLAKVVNPIAKYEGAINKAGFHIGRKEIVREPIEDAFFKQPLLQSRLIKTFRDLNPAFKEFPKFQMEQAFHEYVVKLK